MLLAAVDITIRALAIRDRTRRTCSIAIVFGL